MSAIPAPSPLLRFLGPTDPDWYRDHRNLALLLAYLDRHGLMDDTAYAIVEKPWKYTREWRDALVWHSKETA